jgi:hypothetical protein
VRRLAALLVLALALPAAADAAAKGPVFGLRAVGNPKLGYFVYKLAPGAVQHGSVIVTNVGNAAGTVRVYPADGTTGPTTGTVYKTAQKPTGTGAWLSLAQSSFALAPGGQRKVPFTVRVPASAQAGEWVAGIVAETSEKVASQKPGGRAHVQIRIRNLTIVAVQVNVPGKRVYAFRIGRVTTGGSRGFQKVLIQVANDGNVLAKPRGVVTVYDKSGRLVETLSFGMDTFLPHTEIDYPVLLKRALPPGQYSAVVRLVLPSHEGLAARTVTSRPSFSVSKSDVQQVFSSSSPTQAPPGGTVASTSSGLPTWAYAAIAAGAVLAVLLVPAWLLRRRGRGARPEPPGTTLHRPVPQLASPPPPRPQPTAAPPEPVTEAPPRASAHEHEWDVAYDRGSLGQDGVWRFPHRCRLCGVELLARDVADASAQAPRSGDPPRADA